MQNNFFFYTGNDNSNDLFQSHNQKKNYFRDAGNNYLGMHHNNILCSNGSIFLNSNELTFFNHFIQIYAKKNIKIWNP